MAAAFGDLNGLDVDAYDNGGLHLFLVHVHGLVDDGGEEVPVGGWANNQSASDAAKDEAEGDWEGWVADAFILLWKNLNRIGSMIAKRYCRNAQHWASGSAQR